MPEGRARGSPRRESRPQGARGRPGALNVLDRDVQAITEASLLRSATVSQTGALVFYDDTAFYVGAAVNPLADELILHRWAARPRSSRAALVASSGVRDG